LATHENALGKCGSYELLVELASGGMATVFLARAADRRDAPLVAIKRPHRHLAKDRAYLTMLIDEARLASTIRHDKVVKVRELGFEGGEPFIVLDYVEGAALSEIRRELTSVGRAIDPRVAVRIGLDALEGLQAAHVLHDDHGNHLGIVHRDVSPHNILLGCDGLARVTDFGIAKAADRVQVTRTHEVKGKLAYLAPERIDRRRLCTVQSDVFSMAVVIWECIAGRRLFRGEEPIETLQEVMTAPIPSLRRLGAPVSEPVDTVVIRGLSRDLEIRYKTAAEFASALDRAAGGREGIASHAEVAGLVEALFGETLRVRHANIRSALAERSSDVDHVLEVSGLNPRPAPTPEMRADEQRRLEDVAPPAPSARYAFGEPEKLEQTFASARAKKAFAIGVGALLALAGGLILFRDPAPAQTSAVLAVPTSRRVVVPLPFVASKVTFDDQARDLTPPADVVAFEVPRESGARHRVTAIATDGARAEAYVREQEGVARPEGADFAIESLETYPGEPVTTSAAASAKPGVRRRAPRSHGGATSTTRDAGTMPGASTSARAMPVGSVKDGFTKLR
jgi:serine/threonine-protein kinase